MERVEEENKSKTVVLAVTEKKKLNWNASHISSLIYTCIIIIIV